MNLIRKIVPFLVCLITGMIKEIKPDISEQFDVIGLNWN